MSSGISSKRRKFQTEVGELGKVKVWPHRDGPIRYQVLCRQCQWSSKSDGRTKSQGSGWAYAMHQWGTHLQDAHGVTLDGWDKERTAALVDHAGERMLDDARSLLLADGLTPESVEAAIDWLKCAERGNAGD